MPIRVVTSRGRNTMQSLATWPLLSNARIFQISTMIENPGQKKTLHIEPKSPQN